MHASMMLVIGLCWADCYDQTTRLFICLFVCLAPVAVAGAGTVVRRTTHIRIHTHTYEQKTPRNLPVAFPPRVESPNLPISSIYSFSVAEPLPRHLHDVLFAGFEFVVEYESVASAAFRVVGLSSVHVSDMAGHMHVLGL